MNDVFFLWCIDFGRLCPWNWLLKSKKKKYEWNWFSKKRCTNQQKILLPIAQTYKNDDDCIQSKISKEKTISKCIKLILFKPIETTDRKTEWNERSKELSHSFELFQQAHVQTHTKYMNIALIKTATANEKSQPKKKPYRNRTKHQKKSEIQQRHNVAEYYVQAAVFLQI